MDHWCGIFSGICTNSADPLKQGRIKVQVPAVMGTLDLAEWAVPCRRPGWKEGAGLKDHVFIDKDTGRDATGSVERKLRHAESQPLPKPGESVWIMFEGGDVDRPVWMGVQ